VIWIGFRKSFPQLLCNPGSGRMISDIEMKDPAATVFDDKETGMCQ
jgi:hypothetical protein